MSDQGQNDSQPPKAGATEGQGTVDRIVVEVTIAAPAGEVWEAIRDSGRIRHWFGWDAPSLEEEIEFIFQKTVREEQDQDRLTLWFVGMPDRFEIEPKGDGCVLRLVRAAPADKDWDDVYEDVREGWVSFVYQLKLAIERHGLAERRTFFMAGANGPRDPGLITALGLNALRSAKAGEPFSVELPAGERVDGEAWHHSPWQVGLTVPQWGDGLLIAGESPATEKSPHGGGMLLFTTYELSDEAFNALEARWKEWWQSRG